LLVAPLPYLPKSLVWKLSQRYIAGKSLNSACETVQTLNAKGCRATVDVLGEDTADWRQVSDTSALYRKALDRFTDPQLNCSISIKLSDFGLKLDVSRCLDEVRSLLEYAHTHGNFVRIDMEDATVTDDTLRIFESLRQDSDAVGIVIQAYLRRSRADIDRLLSGPAPNVRLCKGIYLESDDVALQDADEIRQSYEQLLVAMFSGGAAQVAIATHDPLLVAFAETYIRENSIDKSRYEFQMLLGVAENLRATLVENGHPVCVYVPFGERWFAYSLRRLHENPQIAGHIVRNLFTRH